MTREVKVNLILERLGEVWPEPKVELDFSTPWELLVATILAAQATDKLVNTVTPGLFERYPDVSVVADALVDEIDEIVRKVNFHKNKASFIVKSAKMIMDKYGGKVPETMAELVALPGVARKTANVVLGDAYGKQEGVIVDTHVKRLAFCLGLTKEIDPVKIERDLMEIVPRKDWIRFSHLLTLFGRYKCPARKKCCECEILGDLCDITDES